MKTISAGTVRSLLLSSPLWAARKTQDFDVDVVLSNPFHIVALLWVLGPGAVK